MKKRYAVNGLMDWLCEIPVGKGKVLVQFSGGAFSQLGMKPATFTTSKPFFQKVIENSIPFKSGKIYLEKVMEEQGDTEQQEKKLEKKQTTTVVTENVANPTVEVETIQVDSLAAAQDVLMSRYGVTRSSIRTWDSVTEYAEKKGIKIEKNDSGI